MQFPGPGLLNSSLFEEKLIARFKLGGRSAFSPVGGATATFAVIITEWKQQVAAAIGCFVRDRGGSCTECFDARIP